MVLKKRNGKKDEASGEGQGGFARAFLEIAVELAVWVFSTVLITIGVFLFLFGILDFSPESRFRTAVIVVLVPLAIYVLIRVGRQILADLKSGDDSR